MKRKATPKEVTQKAIDRCSANTDRRNPGWNEKCFKLLLKYIKRKRNSFMCENFIAWCEGKIEMPDTLRAFGGIIRKAAYRGFIKCVDKRGVQRLSSHSATASVWVTAYPIT